jgi:hypothetical protein
MRGVRRHLSKEFADLEKQTDRMIAAHAIAIAPGIAKTAWTKP